MSNEKITTRQLISDFVKTYQATSGRDTALENTLVDRRAEIMNTMDFAGMNEFNEAVDEAVTQHILLNRKTVDTKQSSNVKLKEWFQEDHYFDRYHFN